MNHLSVAVRLRGTIQVSPLFEIAIQQNND